MSVKIIDINLSCGVEKVYRRIIIDRMIAIANKWMKNEHEAG